MFPGRRQPRSVVRRPWSASGVARHSGVEVLANGHSAGFSLGCREGLRRTADHGPRTADYNHPMYSATLLLHSWLRWAVILFGLIAIWRAIEGVRSRRAWLPGDDRVCKIFLGALDLQMLLGLLLYFVFSPLTKAALGDFAGAMKDPLMRFWAVEHVFGMLIGVALAHAGMSRARRAATDTLRHRRVAIFFILALLIILASIPWPGRLLYGRPLFRW